MGGGKKEKTHEFKSQLRREEETGKSSGFSNAVRSKVVDASSKERKGACTSGRTEGKSAPQAIGEEKDGAGKRRTTVRGERRVRKELL